MKQGDRVKVYPHGSPETSAEGTVVTISKNGRAIAVAFGEKPLGFKPSGEGIAIHPEHGIMMLATRVELDGKPWGPWIETFYHGHFEIEEIDA